MQTEIFSKNARKLTQNIKMFYIRGFLKINKLQNMSKKELYLIWKSF